MRTRTDKQKVGAQFVSRHDRWNIDGHKLMYHVDRVYRWLNGKTVYPVYLEMGVYGGCNHRCVFCAFDYLAYKPELLEVGFAKNSSAKPRGAASSQSCLPVKESRFYTLVFRISWRLPGIPVSTWRSLQTAFCWRSAWPNASCRI